MQEFLVDMAFSMVTMGYLLLKVVIAWQVVGLLSLVNTEMRERSRRKGY